MAGLPTALLWRRLDTAGAEQVICHDGAGLRAKGTMLAASPVPYACRYEVYTDETWATARCELTVEGAGFLRSVRLERAAGRWRVTATEQGNLDAALRAAGHARADQPGCEEPSKLYAALDVVIGGSALSPTLPIRRLRLLNGAGGKQSVDVAWVLVPSLEVLDDTWTYQLLEDGRVRVTGKSTSVELDVDQRGYVRHYPGLADLA